MNEYPETGEKSPSLKWCALFVARATLIPVLVIVACLALFAVTGCTHAEAYRATHRLSFEFKVAEGKVWAGVGVEKSGLAEDIEILEGEPPFVVRPGK